MSKQARLACMGLFCSFCVLCTSRGQAAEHLPYSCVFYNLENLFHPSNDSLLNDDEFTPEGMRHWTYYRYWNKITAIAKVILASDPWEAPGLLCLSEVENQLVLQDLVKHPLLMKFPYEILHRDSPDHRGMDVAILYRKDQMTCIDTSWFPIRNEENEVQKTREILCALFKIEKDTLLCAVNHWTSNYGGDMEGEAKRIRQARILKTHLNSLRKEFENLDMIVGGDFNDWSGSRALCILEEDHFLMEVVPEGPYASYKYQGKWNSIDHVFVHQTTFGSDGRAELLTLPHLLEEDAKYTGMKPYRTYSGYTYQAGISDHLPLIFHFSPGSGKN